MKALLHDQTLQQLEVVSGNGSYIFHGARSVGKATAATQLARRINCRGDQPDLCQSCRQFESGNYADFIIVQPEDKPSILIEQIRSLNQALSLSLYHPAGVRVVLVDDAHMMTAEAQNALLKLIEEPPPQTMFILVAERLGALLPTVRSRCAAIYFPRLSEAQISTLLTENHGVAGPQAANLAAAADGAPGLAISLAASPDIAQERLELKRQADSASGLPPFGRLILAGQLIAAKADLTRFGQLLQTHIVAALRADQASVPAASRQLQALERFRQQLQAKVAPRVALERLMLEL